METQEERALQNRIDELEKLRACEQQEHAVTVARLDGKIQGLVIALQSTLDNLEGAQR